MEDHFSSLYSKKPDTCVRGADLLKFYSRPPKSDCKPGDTLLEPDERVEFTVSQPYTESSKQQQQQQHQQFVSKSIQTDYRESEAQTDPWDPPYNVTKVYNEPEVLSLSKLSYGDGLPAGLLEVKYLAETREHKNTTEKLRAVNTNQMFVKHKQLICEQVRNEWNYRLAVENQKLNEKLISMQSSVIKDFQKHVNKKETCLKNMWMHRKNEMSKSNLKLEQKLHRELMALETNCKKFHKIESDTQDNYNFDEDITTRSKSKRWNEGLDHELSNFYVSNPTGVSAVKSWLEKKSDGLTTQIPLIKNSRRTTREKMAEKAYQDMIDKKRAKLPPKIYHEDFVKEKSPTPSVKSENVLEVLDFEEDKIDMVTVLQQALRGFAHQKQMLELIERHKDGLATIFHQNNEID